MRFWRGNSPGMVPYWFAFLTCRGGWPSAVEMDRDIALDPFIWLLRRDGRYGLIEIKLGGEALVPYGTYRCRQHCIQTPRGWHLCRSDRLSETLIWSPAWGNLRGRIHGLLQRSAEKDCLRFAHETCGVGANFSSSLRRLDGWIIA